MHITEAQLPGVEREDPFPTRSFANDFVQGPSSDPSVCRAALHWLARSVLVAFIGQVAICMACAASGKDGYVMLCKSVQAHGVFATVRIHAWQFS